MSFGLFTTTRAEVTTIFFSSLQRLKSLSYFGICLYYTENDTCYTQA